MRTYGVIALALLVLVAGAATLALVLRSGTSAPHVPSPPAWRNVVDDQFTSNRIPAHWQLYRGPYANRPHNCTSPTHDYVANGRLNIVEKYEAAKPAGVSCPYGAGWYTGGLKIDPIAPYVGNDQRVTVRYRVVSRGGVVSQHIIPMRWPANRKIVPGMNQGEEDFLDTDTLTGGHFVVYPGRRGGGRIRSSLYSIRMTRWHTVRLAQFSHGIYAYVDDMTTPVWAYHGDSTTIPDIQRTTVLQQECPHPHGCPTSATGSEDIQIDWITVDTASKQSAKRVPKPGTEARTSPSGTPSGPGDRRKTAKEREAPVTRRRSIGRRPGVRSRDRAGDRSRSRGAR
jgi:hypothetical protein